MEKEQNNAGFSLVEVILAMAILAILAIPMLNYFVESMKYNAQMAAQQHATMLAQELCEDLKSKDQLIQMDGAYYGIPYLTDAAPDGLACTKTAVADPTGDPFMQTGMGTAEYHGEKDNYDIVVKVKSDTVENSTRLSEVSSIDDTSDVLAAENGQRAEALAWFQAVNASYAASTGSGAVSDIEGLMRRTVTIHEEKSGAYYRVTVGCSYQCDGLRGAGSTDTYDCRNLADQLLKEADPTHPKNPLKHVYVMFSPSKTPDTIQITERTGVTIGPDVELYLIEQDGAVEEPGYRVTIQGKIPSVRTNLATAVLYNGNNGSLITAQDLITQAEGVRKIDLEIAVYKKGEAGTGKPYITVHASKGE